MAITKDDINKITFCRTAIEKHIHRDRSTTDHVTSINNMNKILIENGFTDFDEYLKWDESKCLEHYQENFVIEGECDGCVGYGGEPPCRVWALQRIAAAEKCTEYAKYESRITKYKELFQTKLPIDWDRKKDVPLIEQIQGRFMDSFKKRRKQPKSLFNTLKSSLNTEDHKVRFLCPPGHGYYINLNNVVYKFDVGWGGDLWPSNIPN